MRPLRFTARLSRGGTLAGVTALLSLLALAVAAMIVVMTLHEAREEFAEAKWSASRWSHETTVGIDGALRATQSMLSTLAAQPAFVDQDPAAAARVLRDVLDRNPLYVDLWATRADGWSYATVSPEPGAKPAYIGDQSYFSEAMAGAGLAVQALPDSRPEPRSFAVGIAYAVRGRDGKVNGAVGAGLDSRQLAAILNSLGLPAGTGVTVVDVDGRVIAGSGGAAALVGRKVTDTPLWPRLGRETKGVYQGKFLDQEPRVVGFARLKMAPWTVLVDTPRALVYAPLWSELVQRLALLAVFGLALLGLAALIGKIALEKADALETLRRQEVLLETLVENSPIGISVVHGPDHRCTLANRTFRNVPGVGEAAFVGRSIAEVLPEVLAGRFIADIEEVYRTGRTVIRRGREVALGPGGGQTYWDGYFVPLLAPGGTVEAVIIIGNEVTEQVLARRRAEELAALTESNLAELETLLDSITDGLIVADPAGNIIRVNPAALAMHGYQSTAEMLKPIDQYRQVFELYRDDGGRMPLEDWPLNRALRGETFSNYEARVYNRLTGQTRFLGHNGAPVVDKTGEMILAVITIHDITAERKAQADREIMHEEAQRRAAVLDATFNSVVDLMFVYDPEGRIVRMNPAARLATGYGPDVEGLTLTERAPSLNPRTADGRPLSPDEVPSARALRGETVVGSIMVCDVPAGSRWTSNSASPIRAADGRMLGAVVTAIDITAFHELQEQRDDILRAVSHDLRSPLTAILGHAQLLQKLVERGAPGPRLAQSATAIEVNSLRMNDMIQDLVDAVRLEAGQKRLNRQVVRLGPFMADFLERVIAEADQPRVALDVPADLGPVFADPKALERILTNLLANALKYSPPQAEVTVRAARNSDEVLVSVVDHGQGIDPNDTARLFGRFYRGSNTAATRPEGLGLGLYITRLLVGAHGGRIWVDSEPGKGSVFTFTIPDQAAAGQVAATNR